MIEAEELFETLVLIQHWRVWSAEKILADLSAVKASNPEKLLRTLQIFHLPNIAPQCSWKHILIPFFSVLRVRLHNSLSHSPINTFRPINLCDANTKLSSCLYVRLGKWRGPSQSVIISLAWSSGYSERITKRDTALMYRLLSHIQATRKVILLKNFNLISWASSFATTGWHWLIPFNFD
jgi:hypothetical protein